MASSISSGTLERQVALTGFSTYPNGSSALQPFEAYFLSEQVSPCDGDMDVNGFVYFLDAPAIFFSGRTSLGMKSSHWEAIPGPGRWR